jgi:methylmalonyl-CoA mutase cobalamin-binding subunit
VLIPVISAVEIDYRLELLDDGKRALVEQGLRDIVEDLGASLPAPSRIDANPAATTPTLLPAGRVYCLPARAERDELAGTMLVQLLRQQGIEAHGAPSQLEVGELISLVETGDANVVCISVVAPSTVLHARYLCLKLRARLPEQKIVVGLWGTTENVEDATRRVRDSGANDVVTTLADAVQQLAKLASPPVEKTTPVAS